ncbi:MAG: glutamate formimidoyltransferase [Gemmatimonadota bacterium]|nr:glutamate formimidoyltransferase [Gemmatimonadota bacterium]
MVPVVEAVPNFSEGRDPGFVSEVARRFSRTGCEVLHTTSDPDHNRSVVTVVGPPEAVEDGAVEAARFAHRHIDLRAHRGVHPRIGALDVLPFVPLAGMDMSQAAKMARRAGGRISRLGVPVYLYGMASRPPGRGLASIRRGGFEALVAEEPTGRPPADFPGVDENGKPAHLFAHPTAGGACVGARRVLLAWNVDVEGVSLEEAGKVASGIRESGGGFRGLRALALFLPGQGRTQISMSLETPDETGPMEVFAAIESGVERLGGRVVGTEVVGMAPDAITSVVAGAMAIRDWSTDRILSRRVAAYVGTDPMA